MTDQEIADDLNAQSETYKIPIPSTSLLAWAAANGRFMKIKHAADNPALEDVSGIDIRSIANAAHLLIVRDGTRQDMTLPDRVSMINTLIMAGVLEAADKTSLDDLATVTGSKAEKAGAVDKGKKVRANHVSRAKEWPV